MPTATPLSRKRYLMLLLVFGGTVLNFADRTNLSVAAPTLKHVFHLDPLALGVLFSAYAWTYVLANIPGGWIVDRIGSRVLYAGALLVWSAFTVMQGTVTRFGTLFGLRLGVGVAEAPTFPLNNRVVTLWFAQHERGFATSTYLVGQYVGMAALTTPLFWIGAHFGWRAIFFTTGAIGIVWALAWLLVYRDPPTVASEPAPTGERRQPARSASQSWRELSVVLRNRQIVAICAGKFASLSALYFFLTWFPTYLIDERHMAVLKAGAAASVPFLAASVGVLIGGGLSDWLLRRGAAVGTARKVPIVTGLLLVPSMTLAAFAHANWLVIAIMSFAFFSQGLASVSWSLIGDIVPPHLLGIAGGAVNFAGNVSGIVTPIAVGYIVKTTGTFTWALVLLGAIAVAGALCYVFLLGEVRQIELADAPEREVEAVG